MSDRYTLIVKGAIPIATRAAREHGIIDIIGTQESIPNKESVLVVDIPRGKWTMLHEWLQGPPHEAPYPDGVLLTFVRHTDYHDTGSVRIDIDKPRCSFCGHKFKHHDLPAKACFKRCGSMGCACEGYQP